MRGVRAKVARRMRIEGRDDRGTPFRFGARHRTPDHRLMAAMEAVEIAERDHRAAQGLRQRFSLERSVMTGAL